MCGGSPGSCVFVHVPNTFGVLVLLHGLSSLSTENMQKHREA